MENTSTAKIDQEEQGNMEGGVRVSEMSPVQYDFKQELAQYADVSAKFGEDSNKMYICPHCDFRTAFRNSLLNHQAVHSDVRPWVCAMCDYAAKRKQDLKKHLHTIHGVMVESTMLKPVGLPPAANTTAAVKTLSRGESSEENSWDSMKLNKAEANQSNPLALYPSTTPGAAETLTVHIKQEKVDRSSSQSSQEGNQGMSNLIQHSPPDSPDYDLPISFSPSLTTKSTTAHSSQTFAAEHISSPDGEQKMVQTNSKIQNLSTIKSVSSQPLKRPSAYIEGSDMSKSHDLLSSPSNKLRKVDSDDHLQCSSSISISHTRASQTPTSFLCEHCDIMYFQRAMYLMHVGLHAPDNPWCCTVCGSTFTEKYSFTSHFINQH